MSASSLPRASFRHDCSSTAPKSGPPPKNASRDYAYATSTTLAVEDRRKGEKDLLRLYLEKMAEFGVPKIAFDDAWLAIRQQLPTALAYWTITLRPAEGMPPMQPESISYELIKRITAAMDDTDSLDSLR